MRNELLRRTSVVLAISGALVPVSAGAQCTDDEVTAVALVRHIQDPALPLALGHVRITPVPDPTPPLEGLTVEALDFLRTTTLLRDFDGCGPYEAVGYAYTPAVGKVILEEVVEVVVLGGRLPVDYFAPTALERGSWGRIKAIYRER